MDRAVRFVTSEPDGNATYNPETEVFPRLSTGEQHTEGDLVSESSTDTGSAYIAFRRVIGRSPSINEVEDDDSSGLRFLKSASFSLATDFSSQGSRQRASSIASVVTENSSVPSQSGRDDEPTCRIDDSSIDARSQGTNGGFNSQQTTPVAFCFPADDRRDMRVVCPAFAELPSHLEVKVSHDMPVPRKSIDTIIAIEASSVSPIDCCMRQGGLAEVSVQYPFTSGCDFVGTVVKTGSEAFLHGINEGDRVAAVVAGGGNARFITVPAHQLVKIPDSVSSDEAASVMLPFLIAFQTLHAGQNPRTRYASNSLEGKSVLLADNAGLVGFAMASLARLSGVKNMFIVSPKEFHSRIRLLGSEPLHEDPDSWTKICGKVDVLIETRFGRAKLRNAKSCILKEDGRLVRIGTPVIARSMPAPSTNHLQRYVVPSLFAFQMKEASFYELFFSVQQKNKLFQDDFKHIINLLAERQIRSPGTTRRIDLGSVARAQSELQLYHQEGSWVCKPWQRDEVDEYVRHVRDQ